MTPSHDDQPGQPQPDVPLPYKYRYKYLHKYGDEAPPRAEGAAGDGGADENENDGRPGNDRHGDGKGGKPEGGKEANKDDGGKDNKDKDDKDGKDGEDKPKDPEADRRQKRKRRLVLLIIALVFLLAGLAWLLYYLLVLRYQETTDDAYVQGDMVIISPLVAGTVVEVDAEDTERVHAGQVLVRLDPVDARTSLLNAEGQLAQAVRQARQSLHQAAEADAAVAQRQAELAMQRDNYRRRFPLLDLRAVSREEVDTSQRQLQSSAAAVQQAQAQARAAHSQVDGTDVHDFPSVIQARAQFRNAWVGNVRNAIVSPVEGYAARRQVQVGQRVQPGQNLLTVVPLDSLWVDANFKETQLQNVRIGQPVKITTDIYSDATYHGKVVGLSPGTGSAFSLLPAENATGNWIKIVQRLPVRVALDPRELRQHPLRIGLSTYATVDTHDRGGQVLAQTSRQQPLITTAVYEQELHDADRAAEAIIQANLAGPADPAPAPAPRRGH